MIFKTTEEVINAPLSIQEQTFLAQKQLQKYHFQKYIKSEAVSDLLIDKRWYCLPQRRAILGSILLLSCVSKNS